MLNKNFKRGFMDSERLCNPLLDASTRLTCAMVSNGVDEELRVWRETNKKARKGLRIVDHRAFLALVPIDAYD